MSPTASLHVCATILMLLLVKCSNAHSVYRRTANRTGQKDQNKQIYLDTSEQMSLQTGYEDIPRLSLLSNDENSATNSTLEMFNENVTVVTEEEKVTHSTSDVNGTNVNSISHQGNVTNSTSDVNGTNNSSMSPRDNVTNSTSEVTEPNTNYMSPRDSVRNSTFEVYGRNLSSMSPRDYVTNSTSDENETNINFMLPRANVTNVTSDVHETNISPMLQGENVTNVTSEVNGTNISSMLPLDNVTNSTSDVYGTNISSLSQEENETNSNSKVYDTRLSSISTGENVTHSTSEVAARNITSMSHREIVTNSTSQVLDSNDNFVSQREMDNNMHAKLYSEASNKNNIFDQKNNISHLDYRKYNNTSSSMTTENQDIQTNSSKDSNLKGESLSDLETEEYHLWENDSLSNHSNLEDNSSDSNPIIDTGCVTCRLRAIDKHYRILQFKNQILNTLHITNMPNISGVPIPRVPALINLYEMDVDLMRDSPKGRRNGRQDNEYEDDIVVKTERIFISAKEAPLALHLNLTDTIYFPPAVQLFTSDIKSAYLWFYIRKHETPPPYVSIESIIPQSKPGRTFVTKKIFSLKLPKDKAFGWKRVDLKDTLRQWIKHPMSNFGLQIKAEDSSGNNLIVLPLLQISTKAISNPRSDDSKNYKSHHKSTLVLPRSNNSNNCQEPWLDTKIIEPRHNSRRRRSESLMCVENSTDSRCCRHPLLVGFAEFGWDWIIAPTHVNADYCTGECRMTMQDNTPYSWVNQQMPGTNSCCTPTKLSPLPLLYFDESMNVVYQILQNMKVDKCGCA